MATPPVFNVGQYNTAAYMNSIGLWLIKSQTVGTGVSSVTVTNAFSTDFDNYRIIYANGSGTSVDWLNMTLSGATPGSYAWGHYFIQLGAAAGSTTATGSNVWRVAVMGGKYQTIIDVGSPFLTVRTTFNSVGGGDFYTSTGGGFNSDLTSSTGFTFTPATGTISGGIISVYGYRK